MRPVIAAMLAALVTSSVAAQADVLSDRDKSGAGILLRLLDHPELQRGQIDLRDVNLDEAAALASMLRQTSLATPQHGAADISSTLYRLRLNFQRSSAAFVIRDGVACHEDFAATFDGQADLPAGELHFTGVIWPAKIPAGAMGLLTPVVGAIAKGVSTNAPPAPHRGVFPLHDPNFVPIGISYALSGLRSNPVLRINPFADEYPGALRRVAATCGGD
jgi:hypothetical protein